MPNAIADIAVVGLAVMCQSYILNMANHDVNVVAYNRTVTKVQEFLDGPPKANLFSVPLPLQRCSPS